MPRHPFISWWLLVLSDPSTSADLACSQPSPSSGLPSPLSLLVVDGPWLGLLLTASGWPPTHSLSTAPSPCNAALFTLAIHRPMLCPTGPAPTPPVALHQPSIMASCGPPHLQISQLLFILLVPWPTASRP
ncbi:hypothetical protein GOP47_0018284 [Adiantum capillus-veneris]|uniref:Secreted protein n=1 Tax=Adiantum capillus-veneris TaxID=13818 RepID=A0A9D4UI49_ADICA|nr:hypothetical protein GOP47_0018284 [Adiantum capillus-veneris]